MSTATPPASPAAPVRRIAALDGVRAISVLIVLAFHVRLRGFSAGFLGVDAFFVLSGYLITGLLLRDVREYGRVRFATFWSRRVRRLLPAALVVIGAVVVWGAAIAPGYERDGLRRDVFASLLNVANWRFISSSSYFSSDGTVSPLQHTWSLAVEEQFYLVWPLLIGLAALLVARLSRTGARAHRSPNRSAAVTRLVGALAALGVVGSVGLLAVLYDPTAPERAYMGTDARVFEPLLGALLACLVTSERVREQVRRFAGLLIIAGVGGLGLGVVVLGSAQSAGAGPTYYRGGALAVSLACGALVLGAAQGRPDNRIVAALGNPPAAWLGRISYGVYLWHWPLAVWLLPRDEAFSASRAALVLVLAVALAAASYYLLELRVQSHRMHHVLTPRRLAMALPVVLLLGIGTADAAVRMPAPSRGQQRLMVIGDSVPARLFPALYDAGTKRGWQLRNAARGGCPAIGVTITDSRGQLFDGKTDCAQAVLPLQAKTLADFKPTMVLWWSRYEEADRRAADGRHLVAGTPEFWKAQRESLRATVDRLAAGGAKVVIVRTDRPGQGMASRCTPTACHEFLRRLMQDDAIRTEWNRMLAQEAARDSRIALVSIDDVYCTDAAAPCNDKLPGGSYARPDGTHFSARAMPEVARALLQRIATLA